MYKYAINVFFCAREMCLCVLCLCAHQFNFRMFHLNALAFCTSSCQTLFILSIHKSLYIFASWLLLSWWFAVFPSQKQAQWKRHIYVCPFDNSNRVVRFISYILSAVLTLLRPCHIPHCMITVRFFSSSVGPLNVCVTHVQCIASHHIFNSRLPISQCVFDGLYAGNISRR